MKDHKNTKTEPLVKDKKQPSKEAPTHPSTKTNKNEKPDDGQYNDPKNERKLSQQEKNVSKIHTPMKIQE